jgi:undecaprenyl-phosphate 4-deoxy-4-formamido-L-arabinose transferase
MDDERPATDGATRPLDAGLSIVIPLYRDEAALREIFERCQPILDAQPDGGVTLDSDLQYPPEEIPKLLGWLGSEYPVVSGYRAERRDPLIRRLITRALTRWLNRQTGTRLRDFGSMFRAYDRKTVDLMIRFTERHRYVPAVVAWLGVPVKEVPITHAPRGDGGSRYRLSTLVEMVFDLVTGYAVFPLRLLTVVGLLASAAGFVGTISFVIYRLVIGAGVSGLVSAFALVFALLGVVLLLVALIGEYVGRIYREAKARPYFVVGAMHRVDPGSSNALLSNRAIGVESSDNP